MAYRVLIVDDSKLARMMMAKLVGTLYPHWTQFEAVNTEDALASVKANKIDIAILDFNMPGRDGLALAGELHESEPAMPVAVTSANHQIEIVDRTRLTGATFLSKPVTQEALAGFLEDAVARLKAADR